MQELADYTEIGLFCSFLQFLFFNQITMKSYETSISIVQYAKAIIIEIGSICTACHYIALYTLDKNTANVKNVKWITTLSR